MKFPITFCILICFGYAEQVQFLEFWKESDAFSEKIYFSIENKITRKLFIRKYERLRQAILFYRDEGVCESTITEPTYEEVLMQSFDKKISSGENVERLGIMLNDWIKKC